MRSMYYEAVLCDILIIQWNAMSDPAYNLSTENPKHGDYNVKCRGKTDY